MNKILEICIKMCAVDLDLLADFGNSGANGAIQNFSVYIPVFKQNVSEIPLSRQTKHWLREGYFLQALWPLGFPTYLEQGCQ